MDSFRLFLPDSTSGSDKHNTTIFDICQQQTALECAVLMFKYVLYRSGAADGM